MGTSFHFWKSERSLRELDDQVMQLLAEVDLQAFAQTLAVELPYGRKRALELATTLALDPIVLLLDEPTQGMGGEDVDMVVELVRAAANRTVLMVEHNLSVVSRLCDRITVLARGSVLAEGDYDSVSATRRCAKPIWAAKPPRSRRPTHEPTHGSRSAAHQRPSCLYGESHILHGVDLVVGRGELVTLLGRNGAGRTTTLRAIMNMVGRRTGSIVVNGNETIGMPAHQIPRLGVGYCPEERGIFASLSVEENLLPPPTVRSGGMSLDELYEMFPNLYERRFSQGTRLSGGEQQMLAMARILRTGANLLLLDEITEGLAPVIVQKLGEVLIKLKQRGLTIVLVEQNFRFAAPLADRHYVMEHGRIIEEIEAADLIRKGVPQFLSRGVSLRKLKTGRSGCRPEPQQNNREW